MASDVVSQFPTVSQIDELQTNFRLIELRMSSPNCGKRHFTQPARPGKDFFEPLMRRHPPQTLKLNSERFRRRVSRISVQFHKVESTSAKHQEESPQ
jgi:hypothetical protein